LALGSQHIGQFDHLDKVHFIIRMVDPPENALNFKSHEIVLGKPSADWRQEADLLKTKNISHIVCRNSGGKGAYAKIKAARELAIPVIIVRMPT